MQSEWLVCSLVCPSSEGKAAFLPVYRCTRGHAASEAPHPCLLEIRDAEDVVSDDSDRVARIDEEAVLPEDHAAVL